MSYPRDTDTELDTVVNVTPVGQIDHDLLMDYLDPSLPL